MLTVPRQAAKVKSKVDKTYNLLVGKLAVLRHQVFECRLAVVRVAGLEPHYVEDNSLKALRTRLQNAFSTRTSL